MSYRIWQTQLHNPRITRNGYPSAMQVQSSDSDSEEEEGEGGEEMVAPRAAIPNDFYN